MKVIKRTHNQQEARIIVSFLNANGVEAELLDGETTTLLPVVGGVRVAVPEDQEPKALSLLRNIETEDQSREDDAP